MNIYIHSYDNPDSPYNPDNSVAQVIQSVDWNRNGYQVSNHNNLYNSQHTPDNPDNPDNPTRWLQVMREEESNFGNNNPRL